MMVCFLLDPVTSEQAIAGLARAMRLGQSQLRRSYRAFLEDVAAGRVPLGGQAARLDFGEPHPLQAAFRRSLAAAGP